MAKNFVYTDARDLPNKLCCNALQCVAVCCSVLQRRFCIHGCERSTDLRVGGDACVLQCVAMCCSLLQCVAVCCSVLQCQW